MLLLIEGKKNIYIVNLPMHANLIVTVVLFCIVKTIDDVNL